MLEQFEQGTLPYYEALKKLTIGQLAQEWQEITVQDYDYFLEVVPPLRMNASSFLVGEPMTHTEYGAIHQACTCITVGQSRRYFTRPAHAWRFNHFDDYAEEIREQFKII